MAPPIKWRWSPPSIKTQKVPEGVASDVAKAASELFSSNPEVRAVAQDAVAEAGKDLSTPASTEVQSKWKKWDKGQWTSGPVVAHNVHAKDPDAYYRTRAAQEANFVEGEQRAATEFNSRPDPQTIGGMSEDEFEAYTRSRRDNRVLTETTSPSTTTVLGAAATVGAGAAVLAGGSSEAAEPKPTQQYSHEFFTELEKSSPEDITSFMSQLSEQEQNSVVEGAKAWRATQDAVAGPADTYSKTKIDIGAAKQWDYKDAAKGGFEDPTTQQSVMNSQQETPQAYSVLKVGNKLSIRVNHRQADLQLSDDPMWKQVLRSMVPLPMVGPDMARQAGNLSELETKLLDPMVVEPTQKALASTKFSSLKKLSDAPLDVTGGATLLQPVAKAIPNAAMPVADYLYKAGTRWVFGKDNFDYLPPNEVAEATNDLDAIFRSPVGQLIKGPWMAPETASAGVAALASEAGKWPLFLLGPTRAMELATAGRPAASVMMAGAFGAGQALIDPEQTAVEGGVGGAAFSGVFIGGSYLAKAGQELWHATSSLGKSSVTSGLIPAAERPGYTPAIEQSVLGGVASSTPAEEFTQVLPVYGGKLGLRPSVALVGDGEVRLFQFKAGEKPKVAKIPLNSDKDAAFVDSILDRHGLDPIPVEGALDSNNKYVRNWLRPELGQDVTTSSGAVLGRKAASGDATVAGAGRAKSEPGVVEVGQDGHIDIYRLSSPKLREKAIKSLRPVQAMSMNGDIVRGFLLETPSGLAVHPGHDLDVIPTFVDQIVPVKSGTVQQLDDKTISEVAKLTPIQLADLAQRSLGFLDKYAGKYDSLVTDATAHLDRYAKANPGFSQVVDEAKKATTNFTPEAKKKVRSFILKDQKSVNPEDMFSAVTDDELNAFVGMRRASERPNESPLQRVRNVLKAEFKTSDSITDVLARDVLGLTKRESAGGVENAYREQLLLEWQKTKNAELERQLAAGKMAIPEVSPAVSRPQEPMKAKASSPESVQSSQMAEGAVAERQAMDRQKMLSQQDEATRAIAAQEEMHKRGDPYIPDVYVEAGDGTVGKVMASGSGKLVINTPSGPRTIAASEAKLHKPPLPPAEALMDGLGAYDKPDGMAALTNNLADALANHADDGVLFNAITRQAREDGRSMPEIRQAIRDAEELVKTGAQLDSRGPTKPPSPPTGAPPGPGGGNPKGGPITPHGTVLAKTMLRSPDVIDRMLNAVWGQRSALLSKHSDVVKLVDLAFGAKSSSEQLKRNVERLRNTLGIKQGSQFDKTILAVMRGDMSYGAAQRAYPEVFNNRTIQDSLSSIKSEIDLNEQKLIDLGQLVKDRPDDDTLTNYITNFYMRRFLEPGEWSKIVAQNKPLMQQGEEVFTRFWEKKGLQGDELKHAVEWSLHDITGAHDLQNVQSQARKAGSPQDALKRRTMDELESKIVQAITDGAQSYGGFKPGDVDVLRRLMGQNESGILAIAQTLTKQRALIAQGTMLRKFVAGFPELVSRTPKPGWMEVPRNSGKYGDAAGMFVQPDAYEALISQPEFVAQNHKLLMSISSWVKGNQIPLGGLATFNTNFFGSMKGAVLSGGLSLGRMPEFSQAARVLLNANKKMSGLEAHIADDMVRLGVDAPGFNETELGLTRKMQRDLLYKAMGAKREHSLASLAKDALSILRKPAEVVGAYYDDMDRLWKVSSFLALLKKGGFAYNGGVVDKGAASRFLSVTPEVKRYKSQFTKEQWSKLTYEERLPPAWRIDEAALAEAVKQEATLRITSSFPMPDRVAPLVQKARGAVGVVAPYFTYKSEEARVNAAIAQRIRRGEYGLILRTAGMVAAGVGAAEASRQLAYANGITKEEVDHAFSVDSPSNKRYRYARLVVPMRDSLGRVQFMDFSQYGDWLNAGMQVSASAHGNDPVQARLQSLAKDIVMFPFAGGDGETLAKEMLYQAGLEEAPYSQTLREDQKGVAAVVDGLMRTGALPKAPAWGYDIIRDASQPEGGKYEPATQGQAALRAAGFRSWGVGEVSEKRDRRTTTGEMTGLAKQLKTVATTPEGTWERRVGAGELDKEEAKAEIRKKLNEVREKRNSK